ncbi:MAG: LemA family protein LemA protein [Parcubacteria group bacterium]|nr:LemA family protein LemA protein [Parcubacteria group bacterium]
MSITLIILIVVAVLILWFIGSFNHFVRLRNRAKEALADIDVQLKRRYDLIPNLVNTVKGYATHESSAFENVTKARASAMGANTLSGKAQAEDTLSTAVRGIFVIAEAYPELKANQNFLSLQNELSDTENKIQAARRFYNTNVRDLNTGIESFPGNVIAGIGHFEKMDFFELGEADAAAKNPVEVKF